MRLTYFSGPGGRAEPARLALHISGVPFDDDRSNFKHIKEIIGDHSDIPENQVHPIEGRSKQPGRSQVVVVR